MAHSRSPRDARFHCLWCNNNTKHDDMLRKDWSFLLKRAILTEERKNREFSVTTSCRIAECETTSRRFVISVVITRVVGQDA